MGIELNKNINKFLHQSFNILYHTNILNFDRDFQILINELNDIKKDKFEPNDRIIIEQFDVDFYDHTLRTGLTIRNIIECLLACDIPMFTVIFITNNYMLDQEISLLLKNKKDIPTVLKTVSSKFSIKAKYQDVLLNKEKIKKHAVCLLAGQPRSHRDSIYDFIKKNNFFLKIAVNYKNEK